MYNSGQSNNAYYSNENQMQSTADNQIVDVERRHGEIKDLETDIVHLHEIHRDFAELVQGHDQIIDNIELSVAQTETKVFTGTKALAASVDLQSAIRRKKILCGLLILIVLVIIVIIVVVLVVPKKSK